MSGTGVVFPISSSQAMGSGGDPKRSSSALGRGVVSDALQQVDPVGAEAALRDTGWRRGYPAHFRRLVEAGMADDHAAVTIARDGLESLTHRMRFLHDDGEETALADAVGAVGEQLVPAEVSGTGEREAAFTLPYKGERLAGDALCERLADWVRRGVVEPGVAHAVEAVLDHPEWLDLRGRTVVVLGAGAEMGPLQSLLRWGATVDAVDLPRPDLWKRVLEVARAGAGTVRVPVRPGQQDASDLTKVAGADLLHDLGSVAGYLGAIDGPFTLGNYVYADGGTNLRLSAATDALATHLSARGDVALAYLATPTDVFVVPGSTVDAANARLDSAFMRRVRGPVRVASRGRLLQRQYPPSAAQAISDSIVPQQGPNYLLAKRVHRWRAAAAAADGQLVSMNIAPPTRTRSVTKNRALAAAYAGAHRFGVEVFDPSTSNTLMAALLVHDLHTGGYAAKGGPAQAEAAGAADGGLWHSPYAPRSALGIAAILGAASTF